MLTQLETNADEVVAASSEPDNWSDVENSVNNLYKLRNVKTRDYVVYKFCSYLDEKDSEKAANLLAYMVYLTSTGTTTDIAAPATIAAIGSYIINAEDEANVFSEIAYIADPEYNLNNLFRRVRQLGADGDQLKALIQNALASEFN